MTTLCQRRRLIRLRREALHRRKHVRLMAAAERLGLGELARIPRSKSKSILDMAGIIKPTDGLNVSIDDMNPWR